MKAKLPSNTTGYHLGQVLPTVNRLLRPHGLKVTIVHKGPLGSGWYTHLTLVPSKPKRPKRKRLK